jgi:hypothetical protein
VADLRRTRARGWLAQGIGLALGLVVGTAVGRDLPVGPLAHPITLLPWQLDLYVVGLRLWIQTNVLGLVGAAVGGLLARVL